MNQKTSNVPQWPGWKTTRLIGRGSFGAVYEIEREVFGDVEKAALKMLSIPQNAGDVEDMLGDGFSEDDITSTFQSHLQSIVAEYSLMKKMNGCANIVNCDDVRYIQHEDGYGWDIFIKMELLTPMTKAFQDEIPEEAVTKLAKDMCAALEICKAHDVIHRDIKPQNIFVSPYGDYKLGDFGIAKTVEKTMGGTKIGTYRYMAPEVYNNQPYNSTADIYSLGLVLYWMLNEKRMPFLPLPPEKFTTEMESETRLWRFQGKPLPAPAHGSDELKKIVLKACAFDPKDRYRSATEMLQDLKKLENEGIVEIPPAPPAPPVPVDPPEPSPIDPPAPGPVDPPEKPKKKQMIVMIAAAAAIIAVLLMLFRGCDSNAGKPDEGEVVALTELVATEEPVALYVGDTFNLGIDNSSGKYEFIISNEGVVEISKKGELTAVGAGTATITITCGDESVTVTVNVQDYEMTLSPDTLTLFIDATAPLEVLGLPEGAEVKWTPEDKKVADVDNDGVVTAKGEGTTKITATWKNGKQEYTAIIDVTVEPDGVVLNAYEFPDLYIGDTRTIEATASRADLTVKWDSSNKEIVDVMDGQITAKKEGTATIIATAGTKTAECVVTVQKPSVTLKGDSSKSVFIGDSFKISASANPGTATVKWSSSEEGVAVVDQNGNITAKKAGTAKIVAKIQYAGKPYSSKEFTVKVSKPSVTLKPESLSLMSGGSDKISATTNPGNLKVTWESSDSSVVSVSGGTVKALKESGTATITAKIIYKDKPYTSSCKVTITKPSIEITAKSSTIEISDRDKGSVTLNAKLSHGNGDVKWSISGEGKIASISGNGTAATVTGKEVGKVTVTATYTVKGTTVKDTYDLQVVKAKSTLKFNITRWPDRTSLDNFYLDAHISSNYPLSKFECWGTATPKATGEPLDATCSAFNFDMGVYETDFTGKMVNHIRNAYKDLYNFYVLGATVVGADKSVSMKITIKVYDESGASQSQTITYVLHEG